MFWFFTLLPLFLVASTIEARKANNASVLCYVCDSTNEDSEMCDMDVGRTRKYKIPFEGEAELCFAIATYDSIVRGYYTAEIDCGKDCRVCRGDLCNHWDLYVGDYPRCTICTNCSQVGTYGSGDLRYEETISGCHADGGPFINYYCSIDDMNRTCITDLGLESTTNDQKSPTWLCYGQNCNSPLILKNFTCWSYNGFPIRFHRLAKNVRCQLSKRSSLPGCYTKLEDDGESLVPKIVTGCTSELDIGEVVQFLFAYEGYSFCFDAADCNGWQYRTNECFYENMNVSMACATQEYRCYVNMDLKTKLTTTGCDNLVLPLMLHPHIRFCRNNLTDLGGPACNANPMLLLGSMACVECSGGHCRKPRGTIYLNTCAVGVTQCYTAEGYDGEIERGCWEGKQTRSSLCRRYPQFCKTCSLPYCNDHPAHSYLRPCSETGFLQPCALSDQETGTFYLRGATYPAPPEEVMIISAKRDNSAWQRRRRQLERSDPRLRRQTESFACYQCNSKDAFDAGCAGNLGHRRPTACRFVYGSHPGTCYVLIHRGWQTLERGCGSALDKASFASCGSGKFTECRLCYEAGCNNKDFSGVLLKKNST